MRKGGTCLLHAALLFRKALNIISLPWSILYEKFFLNTLHLAYFVTQRELLLRDQRGILACQIIQDPILYRPFLQKVAKALEEEDGHNRFGYGLSIIKAQAEAHQSKMLQQEMLKSTSDPKLLDNLQTLLAYGESRDLSAALWKELKPKLAQFKETLLSKGFCKEIDAWKDMRLVRDQYALKIVDAWEEFHPLIQKLRLKLSFEVLIDQKDQAVRDTLLKTYTTSHEESVRLQAAFDLKEMMDEEKAAGKKATVSEIYFKGLQPKDIVAAANAFQELALFKTLETDEERDIFSLVFGYKALSEKADRTYRQCAEGTPNSKASDHPLYPEYLQVVSERNSYATALLGSPDWDLYWEMAYEWGVILNEDTVITHSRDGRRQDLIDHYLHTDSLLVRRLIAREIKEMMEQDRKEEHKGTVAGLYQHNILPRDIREEARQFDWMTLQASLKGDAEKQVFSLLDRYGDLLVQSNKHYSASCQEAEEQGVKKEKTPSYAAFQEALKERQEIASAIQQAGKPTVIEGMIDGMGLSVKVFHNDCHKHEINLTNNALSLSDTRDQGIETGLSDKVKQVNEDAPQQKPLLPAPPQDALPLRGGLNKNKDDARPDTDLAAKTFVSLSEKYEKTHWKDPAKDEIRQALDRLAAQHWQDEKFVAHIKNSGSETAIHNIKAEIHLLETELSRNHHQTSGSPPQGAKAGETKPGERMAGQTETPTSPAKVEQTTVELAAKEFVSLSERYEQVHWKDPARNEIRKSLDRIVAAHWQNDRFVSNIKNSGSDLAARKIKTEIHLMETELSRSRNQFDR